MLFVDAGTYKVTKTLYVPPGSKIVGESYSVIMSSGAFFANMNNPQPVVQVGRAGGERGAPVEWSDMIVSTQGPQAGAILIQWNLAVYYGTPSGMWDVHERIGGFIGSNLEGNICPAGSTYGNPACIGAFLGMHVTPNAAGLYMENNWLWTAGKSTLFPEPLHPSAAISCPPVPSASPSSFSCVFSPFRPSLPHATNPD